MLAHTLLPRHYARERASTRATSIRGSLGVVASFRRSFTTLTCTQYTVPVRVNNGKLTASTLLPLLPRCRQRYQSGSSARLNRIVLCRSKLGELNGTNVTVLDSLTTLHERAVSTKSTDTTKINQQDSQDCKRKVRHLSKRRTSRSSTERLLMRASPLRQKSRLCSRLAERWISGQKWNPLYWHTNRGLCLSLGGKSLEALEISC
jgi:hypothetical protein